MKLLPPLPIPSEPEWISYPVVFQRDTANTFYADILNHYKGALNYSDKIVTAHETTHMINADIRNLHGNGLDPVAFYVGNNQATFMLQPKMRKSVIAQFVPELLQGDRFSMYVTGMTEWNDSPLYLYDEWCAYTNGAVAMVDLVEKNLYQYGNHHTFFMIPPRDIPTLPNMRPPLYSVRDTGWTDAVMGPLEFSVYAVATVCAINQNDGNYQNRVPNFTLYTNYALQRAWTVYAKGSVMSQFKWDRQDKYLDNLRNDPQAQHIRDILNHQFNGLFLEDKK